MKAAIATGIEDIDKHIHIKNDWPQPTLATAKDGKTGKLVSKLKEQNHLIVKVLACALAPGDCRLFKGKTDMVQLPKHGRPYVIGSDICAIVIEVDKNEDYFQVGDRIIARFDEPQPNGMCAEYACVKTEFSEKCPSSIPAIEACTLPASAAAAKLLAQKFVAEGNRVLLLGASGGVGTFICQYIKLQGASYLAATTTQHELAKSLGVDRVIDYSTENWWELESEYEETPFDVVIDLVNGQNWNKGARSGTKVLKRKLPYVQLLMGVETEIDVRGFRMVPVLCQMISRSIFVKLHPSCPKWIPAEGLDLKPGDLKSVLQDVEEKKIRVILDSASPFSFETESVRAAMKLQRSIHAHGKVVIEIAKDTQ
jgi:NADPH:quinone reductase-like Zn-dependent oxidoreductase